MERRLCGHCHELVGTYEPIVVQRSDDGVRHGSLVTLRDVLDEPGSAVLHRHCYQALGIRERRSEPDG